MTENFCSVITLTSFGGLPMPDVTPHPKEAQLKPGRPRRYRRKVAGPKQWQALRAEKLTACRVCELVYPDYPTQEPLFPPLELHHLVSRSKGGDDVADNLYPICRGHHKDVEERFATTLKIVARSLTDAEYAYIIGKLGEGGIERLFGLNR